MALLSLKDIERLCAANYDKGGDYVLVMLTPAERKALFCCEDGNKGRRKLYDYMRDITKKREHLKTTCTTPAEWIACHAPSYIR